MQITVTGRHFEITEPLRQHVEAKTAKLGRYIDNIGEVHVVLSVEKHRHLAEVTLQANGTPIRGLEEKHNMYQAFDSVIEKIERQVKRLKEKESSHKGRAGSKEVSSIIQAETERDSESSSHPRVIRSPKMAIKPMSIDEAAMQMGLSDVEFLAFLNPETDQMNVMYKRRDGNYGLIEPEF
ncbi:ribosomal subunit interface protein [candidate division KSB3 bacterium]|uniref:Ribosome hibernation promoting factor n=1 Tax=candidate division KSB3 bacterium TaxID=2044937 RepID=A0A2G6E823_9BACT|nr:MAG: ribosomal subunit interface protein [candidate division KSB3 bacterium]PIE30386.1 MAG: ribosomal subunit interface protein [candidate division KSB3 bacterium]